MASAADCRSLHAVKGAFDNEQGTCVSVDRDGDQVFLLYRAAGRRGEAAKGTGTYVGGTGKYVGITGTTEFTRMQLRPNAPETSASISKTTFSYRLP